MKKAIINMVKAIVLWFVGCVIYGFILGRIYGHGAYYTNAYTIGCYVGNAILYIGIPVIGIKSFISQRRETA